LVSVTAERHGVRNRMVVSPSCLGVVSLDQLSIEVEKR
jgi:hypothetical protein